MADSDIARILEEQHHVYRADLMLPAVELPDNKKAGAFAVFTETSRALPR